MSDKAGTRSDRMQIAFLSKTEVNIRKIIEVLAPRSVIACRSREDLITNLPDADVLVVQNQGFTHGFVDAECLNSAKRLRLIQHHGVTCDATDIEAARKLGIPVATVPGQNSRSVAEHAFFLVLALVRRAKAGQRLLREGRMGEALCTELAGKTLCIVGLGTIGQMVAEMARGFSMKVIGVRRDPGRNDAARQLADKVFGTAELHDAMGLADVILLSLPLNPETADLIGAAEFKAMKHGAMLVNVSRGAHVDRAAIEAALRDGIIGAYATDAYWSEPADPADPLLLDERVFVTPHMGGKSAEAIHRTVQAIAANIARIERGESILHLAT